MYVLFKVVFEMISPSHSSFKDAVSNYSFGKLTATTASYVDAITEKEEASKIKIKQDFIYYPWT